MFRIGDFARFTRVSIKMLRHYDEIGLLPPAFVDAESGYRHYSASQLPRLNRIIALKDLGFKLEEIRALIDEDLTIDQIRGMLRAQQVRTRQIVREEERRLLAIEARLSLVEREESLPAHEVVLRSIPAQRCATRREEVTDRGITEMFESLERYVARFGARSVSPPFMIEHGTDADGTTRDVEAALPISRDVDEDGTVRVRTAPALAHAACVIYTGSYSGELPARSALLHWIEANRWTIAGPPREVYLRFGADLEGYDLPDAFLSDHPEGYVTEIQIPVRRSEEG